MNERFEMERAHEYLGKEVEIELEIASGGGKPLDTLRLEGTIERISEGEGVVVHLNTGGEYRLPPDFSAFELDGGSEVPRYRVRQVLHEPPPVMDVPPAEGKDEG